MMKSIKHLKDMNPATAGALVELFDQIQLCPNPGELYPCTECKYESACEFLYWLYYDLKGEYCEKAK